MSAGPEVSIIMPVRNEAASLDATLAPPMLVGSMAAAILLLRTIPGRVLLAVVGGSYALFLVVGAAILGSRVGVRLAPHAALALATMHLSWGTGFLASAGELALNRIPAFRRLRA